MRKGRSSLLSVVWGAVEIPAPLVSEPRAVTEARVDCAEQGREEVPGALSKSN